MNDSISSVDKDKSSCYEWKQSAMNQVCLSTESMECVIDRFSELVWSLLTYF